MLCSDILAECKTAVNLTGVEGAGCRVRQLSVLNGKDAAVYFARTVGSRC